MDKKIRIVFVIFPQAQVLDITGPLATFAAADKLLPPGTGYSIRIISGKAGPVEMNAPVSLIAEASWIEQLTSDFDTLLVSGGMPGSIDIMANEDLKRLVADAAQQNKRVGSICTGAYVLAGAGVLDQRSCTTHWKYAEQLRQDFPSVKVLNDVIFHVDNNIWTSAGVTAGMDMALAMISQDYGFAIARQVAKELVMFVVRPGCQGQVSDNLKLQGSRNQNFQDLMLWIKANPAAKLDVNTLAERCGMSTRNFTRRFSDEFGITPSKAVEAARVSAAQYNLANTSHHLQRVASLSGFPSIDVMTAAFKRHSGIAPSAYRENSKMSEEA